MPGTILSNSYALSHLVLKTDCELISLLISLLSHLTNVTQSQDLNPGVSN